MFWAGRMTPAKAAGSFDTGTQAIANAVGAISLAFSVVAGKDASRALSLTGGSARVSHTTPSASAALAYLRNERLAPITALESHPA